MKALIIVDVQNDFCPGGALAVTDGDKIVPGINAIRDQFSLVILTQDWHPANHISFAANHPGRKPGDVVEVQGRPQVLWPVHAVQNTPGADFHPGLKRTGKEPIFYKGTDPFIDSYSAFYDNCHDKSTGLTDYLRKQKIDAISLCGLATDYCVRFSGIDALDDGFRVEVLARLCRGVNLNPQDSAQALEALTKAGATIID